MSSVGPSTGNTATNDTTVGGSSWTNPSNALADDAAYATYGPAALDDITYYLFISNFGFSIPSGATIDGLVAGFKRKSDTASLPVDNSIKFFKGGAVHGNELSTGAAWSTSETTVNFGSSSNLSGGSYGPSDINASNFGVGISVADPSVSGWTASINAVFITVYYTEPGGTRMAMTFVGG